MMNILIKNTNRTLWFSAVLLTALLAGCTDHDDSTGSNPPDTATETTPETTPEPEPEPAAETTPTVTSAAPADRATLVALNSKVVATFEGPMDATTINSQSFTVVGADEPALTGTVGFDANSNTASFTPDSNFTDNTLYTATITTAVKNDLGEPLASDYVWTFTSDVAADVTPLTVSSTDPVDTAGDVAPNRSVNAVFSEALYPASVNTNSFTLTTDAGATSVSGAVSYKDKMATFEPASDLDASTLYTATLTTAVTDLADNALEADFVWTFTTGTALAAGPDPVNLRTAANFVILTKTGITNVHTSDIKGDIGASPITAAAIDNVFCSEITGTIYGADAAYTGSGVISCFAGDAADNTLVANAVLDMGTAYSDAAGRKTPDYTELHAGDLSGKTLAPGLYKWGTNVSINGDVTLSGSANDVWIFQVAGDVVQASATRVSLTGGALAQNVFWQVGGGAGVALDTNAHFAGVVLAVKGITVKTGATVNGRLLSQTAVTLDQNTVTQPGM